VPPTCCTIVTPSPPITRSAPRRRGIRVRTLRPPRLHLKSDLLAPRCVAVAKQSLP
jgi:hypothetical protein